MIFNRYEYYLFFLLPCAVLFRLVRPEVRRWVCVAFGAAFFVYFSPFEVVGWLAPACLLILVWEGCFSRLYKPRSAICLVGIVIAVSVLGVFKYWNFATGTLLYWIAPNPLEWKGAFLPLGISFFTFEFIHYAADRYQGKVERGEAGDYFAFIFFFPTMVAGPIKRYQQFAPSLRGPKTNWTRDWNRGITRILVGLVKKFAVADVMTSMTAHLNRDDISVASRGTLALWIAAYGIKIYFDFSAYSDIAIGSARLMGVSVPENFDWPYFRTNITEFWRHWHMSLYKWLVDYVFIPLGGSRGSLAFVCSNIFLVMLVSGLWHGAAFNFVLWGAWHGALLCIHRMWRSVRKSSTTSGSARLPTVVGSWALTYASVTLGWAFFAMDTDTALLFYRRIIWGV